MSTPFRTESISIDLSPGSAAPRENDDATLTIRCLSELTPLDMMDMSLGVADPTGSCVWLGAFLFVEFFARDLDGAPSAEARRRWTRVRSALFPPGCTAVELGAGTGVAGLSLVATHSLDASRRRPMEENVKDTNDYATTRATTSSHPGPSLLVQTDANDDALDLCRINCDANLHGHEKGSVRVKKLEWGEGSASKAFDCTGEPHHRTANSPTGSLPKTFDAVFATDVLYDLESLAPLVATASELLTEGGHFVLSHVPRASVDADENASDGVDWWKRLESIIIEEASKAQLSLASYPLRSGDDSNSVPEAIRHENKGARMVLRPSLLPWIWGASSSLSKKFSWNDYEACGAAVLVFQKKTRR